MEGTDEQLRYPIGKFCEPEEYTEHKLRKSIEDIRHLPSLLEIVVQNMDEYQLQEVYRPGGWSVQQVVHHIADSHMNAYMRFKLALTEDNPTIKPYDEAAWAELADYQLTPVNISLTLLHALHRRWVDLLLSLKPEDFERTIFHPEHQKKISLKTLLCMYSWHGKHHLAHIVALKERNGW